MDTKPDQAHSDIAATFDRRASSYNRNDWHRRCAEQLTEFCGLVAGQVVLDAGTGTGLVAIAAAPHVGVSGRIVAVDLSNGMLRVARQHAAAAEASIEWSKVTRPTSPLIQREPSTSCCARRDSCTCPSQRR